MPPFIVIQACQKMYGILLGDAHRTFVACFHAFYPTGYLKWACLCNLLASIGHDEANESDKDNNEVIERNNDDGYVDRLLAAVLDALCHPMVKLRNTFPITYSPESETRCR